MKKDRKHDPEFYIKQMLKTRQSMHIATTTGCIIVVVISFLANSVEGLIYSIILLLCVILVAALLGLFGKFLKSAAAKNLSEQDYQQVLKQIEPDKGKFTNRKERTHSVYWIIGLVLAFLALSSLNIMLDKKIDSENEVLMQHLESQQTEETTE